MRNIYLIAIGDELIEGYTRDQNFHWLAGFLNQYGLKLTKVVFVADDIQQIASQIESFWQDPQVTILLSGGLGPTDDDLTKNALATFLQSPLIESEQAIHYLHQQYQKRNKVWSKEINDYHLVPQGCQLHFNPVGLAPAISYQNNDKELIALPGVPSEFQVMAQEFLAARLEQQKAIAPIHIKTFGIAEEDLFKKRIPNLWQEIESWGKLSSLPQKGGVHLIIRPHKNDQQWITHQLNKTLDLFKQHQLFEHIWQIGDLPLEQWIIQQLKAKKLTISCAESCTGGRLGDALTNVAGSSDVFMGGVISYSNQSKIDFLSVSAETLKNDGAVSEACALEMARGARTRFKTDLAISTTGIAGPGGGSASKPVGTVCIALCCQQKEVSMTFQFSGTRDELKERFYQKALFLLVENFLLK